MDRYSIFDGNALAAAAAAKDKTLEASATREPLPPPEGHEKSLTTMAERDLQATLQLLADRARYITGASGTMIALLENGQAICRAGAGTAAPQVGMQLQLEGGLAGESLQQKRLLYCEDADEDPRVNRESCRALGIRSVMAMPLVRDGEAAGIFELFADREHAFEESDASALRRLSELVLTALEHAEAARHVLDGTLAGDEERSQVVATEASLAGAEATPATEPVPQPTGERAASTSKTSSSKQCEACGFPVSQGRTLCLDCETARAREEGSASAPAATVELLSQLAQPVREESWFERNMYTIGTIIMAALTVLALWLKFR